MTVMHEGWIDWVAHVTVSTISGCMLIMNNLIMNRL